MRVRPVRHNERDARRWTLTDALPAGLRRAFIITSWVVFVAWIWIARYLTKFDGWGAWGAAPLLLPPVLLSGVFGAGGLLLCARAYYLQRRVSIALIAATLVAAAPISYYLLRNVMR